MNVSKNRAVTAGALIISVLAGATVPAFASWSYNPPAGVSVASGLLGYPAIAVAPDVSGGVFIAWQYASEEVFGMVFVHHVLSSGEMDGAWPVGGAAPNPADPYQSYPALVGDGFGGVIAVCQDAQTGNQHIFAYHLFPAGIPDPEWPSNGASLCLAQFNQRRPLAVSDGSGGAIAAWFDFRGATSNDVYAAHVGYDGQVSPGPPYTGARISNAARDQNLTDLIANPGGGAFVAWDDSRSLSSSVDVYVHKLGADAAPDPAWPVNGLAVCALGSVQNRARLATDGAGGVYVLWCDGRDGVSTRIYVHHALANGTLDPAWTAQGVSVSSSSTGQIADDLILTSDGMLVIWHDSPSEIRVQHVLSTGVVDPSWPAIGLLIGSSGDSPAAVSDEDGGAMLAWGNVNGVFAQHVLSSGSVDPSWPAGGWLLAPPLPSNTLLIPDGHRGGIAVWWQAVESPYYGIFAARAPIFPVLDAPGRPPAPEIRLSVFPQPTADHLSIQWSLPREASTTLDVFDLSGRRVSRLHAGRDPAGESEAKWDLTDGSGHGVSPGLYFVRLTYGESAKTARVLVRK